MLCPLCKVPLQMTVRQEVEIDYCPQCRGIWLDRGELDKLIERSNAELAPVRSDYPPQRDSHAPQQRAPYPPQQQHHHQQQHHQQQYYQQKKRKSFLSDLLDFD